MGRFGGSLPASAAAVGLLLAISGCASPATRMTAVPAVPAGQPTTASSPPAAGPEDPTAPATYVPVLRNGHVPHPSVVAPPGGFSATAPATYPDGLRIKVTGVSRAVEEDQGPGAFPGRTGTALAITLTNGSPRPIDLDQVVVTATYGSPARIAAPVYDAGSARDFAGSVAPGRSASAVYAFAIPTGQERKVVVVVDLDGLHAAAKFTGAVG